MTQRVKKNTDTSNTAPTKAKIDCHSPKLNLVRFEDPYNHINGMDNTHDDTHLIYTHMEQNIKYSEVEYENFFEDTNKNTITEEELEKIT